MELLALVAYVLAWLGHKCLSGVCNWSAPAAAAQKTQHVLQFVHGVHIANECGPQWLCCTTQAPIYECSRASMTDGGLVARCLVHKAAAWQCA
jgi:hypothetical protein